MQFRGPQALNDTYLIGYVWSRDVARWCRWGLSVPGPFVRRCLTSRGPGRWPGLPSVSQIRFIECAGNTGSDHAGKPGADPQRSHGLVSCSEWTGVLLKTLLAQDVRTRPLHLY